MKFEAILSLNLTEGITIPTSFPLVKDNKHYGYVAVYLDSQNAAISEEIQTNCSLVENTLACTLQIDCFKPTKESVKQASAYAKMKTTIDPFLSFFEENNSKVMDLTKNYQEPAKNAAPYSQIAYNELTKNSPPEKLSESSFPEVKAEISQSIESVDAALCTDVNGNESPKSKTESTISAKSTSSTENSLLVDCKTEEGSSLSESLNDKFAEQSTTYVVLADGSYKCRLCDKKFSNKNSIWQHRKTVHELQRFHCKVCSRKFTRKAMLDAHLMKCANRALTLFNSELRNSSFMKRENDDESDPKPLNLSLEPNFKTSPLSNSPRQNFGPIPLHLRPKPYNCHYCQKKLRSVRARNRHHFKCKLNPVAMQESDSPPESKKPNMEMKPPKEESSSSTRGYIGLLQAAPRYSSRGPQEAFLPDNSSIRTPDPYSGLLAPASAAAPLYPLSGYLGSNQQPAHPVNQFSHQVPDKSSIESLASSLFPKPDPFSQALAAANLLASYDATVRQVAQNAVQKSFASGSSISGSVNNPFLHAPRAPENSEWNKPTLNGS